MVNKTAMLKTNTPSAALLIQIQQSMGLAIPFGRAKPNVQVWLAAMLSSLTLEQQGEFYQAGSVVVGCA